MPRSRGSEMPQRQSPRGPHQLRTSSSDSDPPHHRSIADRSPKVGDRRSPRGAPHSDPVHPKKLGTRIADLESQLGQAQEELKVLKDQLASAEAAKKEAQEELEKKTKKPKAPESMEITKQHSPSEIKEAKITETNPGDEVQDKIGWETDVFEVPVEKVTVDPKIEISQQTSEEKETKKIGVSTEPPATPEPKKASIHDLSLANEEITMLKSKLEEKENELVVSGEENENLKLQLNEATLNISTAEAKNEEMTQNLSQLGEELKASKEEAVKLKEKLEAVAGVKEALETEMKKLRVQTEQWRKAADAAAAVLAGGVEMNGRIPERCVSMDKHFGGVFEPLAGGYAGFVGSPGITDDIDDGFSSGKRKGSGIRKFGDLWKKKGNK
ncbi:interactor of constitutive active ROPs 4-like [Mangifera indica]|uniref:interactor of constitutive active ROPs 4-like n=1 Tax=Mangifera indica TaxID=29780 RepID=UPI001CFBAED7|nr:interactor of constitutive active ROPs 4-like [Mangifera indica]XP_044502230.1 interactor of constitutive active ROPs 4-like [Mangifera indica]XP_044502239.1 interactor of constitutive active ROPs 4-like [Mangifera indica]XP_044502249.1 interactor of constitutive active ROPs 4-like [Mangifera indica]XP_044502256.1 interactor of constitutive active ROPs 4-like [Mangifera indica]XP_044502265.1 interactor of constitutive active ROPs 4-like [Mangifera indica]